MRWVTYSKRNTNSRWSRASNVVGIVISGERFVNRDTGRAKGGSRKGRQHHDKLKAMIH